MECVLMNVPDPRPTEIQALAIPELLRQKNPYILCAAETGSGKTLTYLLPIIHHLKQQEQRAASDPGQARRLRRLEHPRAIVLVPSRELSAQLLAVCKALSHVAKFRVMALTNDSRHELVRRLSTGPIDLLISTPTTLLSYVHADTISLASTRHLVLDEADSLFDSGWGTECREIISTIQCIADREGVSHQVVIVSATLPRSVNKVLDEILPGIRKITTPSLHRPLPSLRQLFVDLKSFKGNRQLALLDVLKRNRRDHKTMIFCNTKTSATLLRDKLAALGIPALALYKDAPSREETLRMFAEKVEPEGEDAKAAYRANNILVCTDVASRGVDTTYVDHVVLYDFPTTVVDYLHRVGRTARAGKKGTVTALVGMKDKVLADRIRKARRLGTVLS
ncbi:P-loop containing nucleoside triphosphate hydrolase protein [Jimgerdemannia flammicorona]|uniref:P-loop containing nucleoside triphosphate hydrolase protein n=1 Tax=Jimgerdemannia flammicorona TaxID=994334 RepID=A0A433DI80_9FUNG|nr:P-loop containing nucleoside triphosphate hydrolase protein [Jimgerdemannia flammicorona]